MTKCSECGYTHDIRLEKNKEPSGIWLLYYRCKDCGFHWDKDELIITKRRIKVLLTDAFNQGKNDVLESNFKKWRKKKTK